MHVTNFEKTQGAIKHKIKFCLPSDMDISLIILNVFREIKGRIIKPKREKDKRLLNTQSLTIWLEIFYNIIN